MFKGSATCLPSPYISPHSINDVIRHLSYVLVLTCYLDDQLRPVIGTSRHVFDLAKCEHAVDHPTEHDMFPVEEITLIRCYEELTTIRVWTGVSLEKCVELRKTTSWVTLPSTGDLGQYASPGSFRPDERLSTIGHDQH